MSIRGKEDPYLKIGEANDRSILGNSEYMWALRDIDFKVKFTYSAAPTLQNYLVISLHNIGCVFLKN